MSGGQFSRPWLFRRKASPTNFGIKYSFIELPNRLVNYVCISYNHVVTSACKRSRMLSHSPRFGCRCQWQMKGVMEWRSGLQQARFIRDCVGHRKLIGCWFERGLGSHNGATILHPNTKLLVFQGLFVFLWVKTHPFHHCTFWT